MDDQDDPYALLGVSRDANASQIKAAYRKLALKHHPDKVKPEDRDTANLLFAKISNAYEILSDQQKRADFDNRAFGSRPQQRQQQQQQQQHAYHHDPFAGHEFGFGGHFHDPFEIFRQVFREEFGGPAASFHQQHSFHQPRQPQRHNSSPFMNDPFFADPFGGRSDDFFFGGGGSRAIDPFRSVRGGGGLFGGSLFGGGGRDPFEDMFSSMRELQRQQHHQQHQQQHQQQRGSGIGGSANNNSSYFYSSSSSTSFGGGFGGESVTTQTTRRIVNGKEETVTERVVRKADGTVERQVLRNGQPQALPSDRSNVRALEDNNEDSGFLPWRRSSKRESASETKRRGARDTDKLKRKRSS